MRFIFRSQITKRGKIPNVRSVVATKTEKTIVRSAISLGEKHFPVPSVNRCQKYEMGLHWKTMKPKYMIDTNIMVASVVRIVQTCALRLTIRRRKKPMDKRMRREVTT